MHVGIRTHAHDVLTAHHHAHPGRDGEIARIEEPGMTDHERAVWRARQIVREPRRPVIVSLRLRCAERAEQCRGGRGEHRLPATHDGGGGAIAGEPDRIGPQAQPGDAVLDESAGG